MPDELNPWDDPDSLTSQIFPVEATDAPPAALPQRKARSIRDVLMPDDRPKAELADDEPADEDEESTQSAVVAEAGSDNSDRVDSDEETESTPNETDLDDVIEVETDDSDEDDDEEQLIDFDSLEDADEDGADFGLETQPFDEVLDEDELDEDELDEDELDEIEPDDRSTEPDDDIIDLDESAEGITATIETEDETDAWARDDTKSNVDSADDEFELEDEEDEIELADQTDDGTDDQLELFDHEALEVDDQGGDPSDESDTADDPAELNEDDSADEGEIAVASSAKPSPKATKTTTQTAKASATAKKAPAKPKVATKPTQLDDDEEDEPDEGRQVVLIAAAVGLIFLIVAFALTRGDSGSEAGPKTTPPVNSPIIGSPDTFDRTDTEDGLGKMPAGVEWEAAKGGWAIRDKEVAIVKPELTNRNTMLIRPGWGDPQAQVKIAKMSKGAGLIFRYSNSCSYWAIYSVPEYAAWNLQKTVKCKSVGPDGKPAAAYRQLSQQHTEDGTTIGFRSVGETIEIYVNGSRVLTIQDEYGAGVGQLGLTARGEASGEVRFDDFIAGGPKGQGVVSPDAKKTTDKPGGEGDDTTTTTKPG